MLGGHPDKTDVRTATSLAPLVAMISYVGTPISRKAAFFSRALWRARGSAGGRPPDIYSARQADADPTRIQKTHRSRVILLHPVLEEAQRHAYVQDSARAAGRSPVRGVRPAARLLPRTAFRRGRSTPKDGLCRGGRPICQAAGRRRLPASGTCGSR